MQEPRRRKALKRFEAPGQARFITCSCWQRLPLFGNPSIRDAFADQLGTVRQRNAFRLLGWVIMPEHFHILVIPNLPEWTMPRILGAIKRPFAQSTIERWHELNARVLTRLVDWAGTYRFWQRGGGYDRNIYTEPERLEKLEYIHNNPVERGLVANPMDWPWSSARAHAGYESVLVPIDRVT
ncbi:MAG: transposase [Phycisphaerales bacterium]|nr:transposase [Phycisphaerales bacterium]MCI0629814.1 transposase [Phycisphaerales bacterium]MCI0674695.1 transposase [Phycisphaerales bacterium]